MQRTEYGIFLNSSHWDWLWGPPSLLPDGYQALLPWR